MRAKQISCCFTGHRPEKLPWRYNEEDPHCLSLKRRIADAVEAAYQEGYRHFLCGMALGCDHYFCECVLAQRRRYRQLVDACDYETLVSSRYTSFCMQRRDRYMVDHASLLIAAFDGTPGGTRYTIEYALSRRVSIVDLPLVL